MGRPRKGEHTHRYVIYRERDKAVVFRGTKAECEAEALKMGTEWPGHELCRAVKGAKHTDGMEIGT